MASTTKPAGTYVYQGETKQGYIKDGKTYTDENYTTEVPVGSTVYTNDGAFIKSGIGGIRMDETPVSPTPAKSTTTPVSYTVNGAVSQGYMKDGKTYTDAAMTQRVPNGAIVHAPNGSTYEMTANGGVPTAQTVINDFNNQAKGYTDAYEAAKKAQEKQIKTNVNAAVSRVQAQKDQAYRDQQEADRVAYNAYLRAINPYGANAQQAVALGLGNSGFSETSLTAAGNQYQQNINNNLLARIKAVNDLNVMIEEARASGDEQRANLLTAYAQNIANMGINIAQSNATIAQSAADAAYARTRDKIADERYNAEQKKADEALEYSRKQDDYNRNIDTISTAISLIDKGLSPDSVAKILNLSPDMLTAINGYYARLGY